MLKAQLLVNGMGIVLDEFAPRVDACGSQGGGEDHLKNVLDPTEAKTIQSRFFDFSLDDDMPRFITVQNLGKLMHNNFTDFTFNKTLLPGKVGSDERSC